MAAPLTIRKAESRDDLRTLFEFPWQVYRDDPNWIPPLNSMRRELLSKEKHPAWEYMEGDYFLAWRGDQCVGTIAAFINQRHDEFHGEKAGWFGLFDVLDDAEAAAALIAQAEAYVQARGVEVIRGPQTFTAHEDVGLLIDGFEPPILLMPYHKPYYRAFIEDAGYSKADDMHSYQGNWQTLDQNNMAERFEKTVAWLKKRGGVTARPIDRKNLRRDFELFKEIYNKAWAENWGFVPMTNRELDGLIEGLSMLFDPELACFAEINGEPVGFFIAVPDFNQVLHKAYPRPAEPEPLTLIKAAWHWKLRPVMNQVRVPLMGVVKEHRTKGVDLIMYHHVLNRLRNSPYTHIDCGWISEKNLDMAGTLKGFGMTIYRTYRLYEKRLSSPVI